MTGVESLEGRYSASPLDSCDECQAYWQANSNALLFAASSVGIERGLTTDGALWSYFRDFHKTGHVPARDDVAAKDIAWLCEVVEAAIGIDATWVSHGFTHNHIPDALRLHEVLNG